MSSIWLCIRVPPKRATMRWNSSKLRTSLPLLSALVSQVCGRSVRTLAELGLGIRYVLEQEGY